MLKIPRLGDQLLHFGTTVPHGAILTYLLDVVFADEPDNAGPLSSPLSGRTGSLTLVQTDGNYSISGGQLVIPAQSTPAWNDQELYGTDTIARSAGVVVMTVAASTTTGKNQYMLTMRTSPPLGSTGEHGHYFLGAGNAYRAKVAGLITTLPPTWTVSQVYNSTIVLRNIGAFYFLDDVLTWVDNTQIGDPLYVGMSNFDATGLVDIIRAASLPANATYPVPSTGVRDLDLCVPGTGTGTSSIASPAAGNTFVFNDDCLVELTLVDIALNRNILFDYSAGVRGLAVTFDTDAKLRVLDTTGTIANVAGGAVAGAQYTIQIVDSVVNIWRDNTKIVADLSASLGTITTTNGSFTNPNYTNLTAKTLDGIANLASSNHPGYGLATDVLPGPRAAADTFTHEADCIWYVLLDALNTGAEITIKFRIQDASNYWQIRIQSAGNYLLDEVIATVVNNRATDVAVLSGGERLTIIADGTTIKGFYDTTTAWTYASATNFQTETSGTIDSLGTGGRVSNLVAFPRNLASAPNTPGINKLRSALTTMATG